MFTGIVAGVGRIVEVERLSVDGGVRLTVDARDVPAFAAGVGDSVAIAGACMTAIRVDDGVFAVDTSRESLARTSGLDAPGEVNIETSVRVGDSLGGHLVAGHVDGVGEVVSMTQAHESWQLIVRAPAELSKYFAYKGSVAIAPSHDVALVACRKSRQYRSRPDRAIRRADAVAPQRKRINCAAPIREPRRRPCCQLSRALPNRRRALPQRAN
jgi:riboflavin synthase